MDLNQKILAILKKKKFKISFAESCTGGLLSASITSVSGSSKIFSMGLITYSNQSKITLLKIPKNIIQKYGAVSVQCCLTMLNNLSKISKSKVCISITGIAGPQGGTRRKPVGLVYIGIKIGKKVVVNKCNLKIKGEYLFKNKLSKNPLIYY